MEAAERARAEAWYRHKIAGTQFTCFTGTKVQILTLLLLPRLPSERDTPPPRVYVLSRGMNATANVRYCSLVA